MQRISFGELTRRYKEEKNGKVKQRLHILLLSKEGKTQRQIAQTVWLALGQVNFWVQRFKHEGYDGLSDKPGRGRKPRLTVEQLRQLKETIDKPIQMKNGYTRGWQTKDLMMHIRQTYGVTYSPRGARNLFKRFDFVRLVPRPRSKKRNQEAVNVFKKHSRQSWMRWEKKTRK